MPGDAMTDQPEPKVHVRPCHMTITLPVQHSLGQATVDTALSILPIIKITLHLEIHAATLPCY